MPHRADVGVRHREGETGADPPDFSSSCAERSGVAGSIIALTDLDTATTRNMTVTKEPRRFFLSQVKQGANPPIPRHPARNAVESQDPSLL